MKDFGEINVVRSKFEPIPWHMREPHYKDARFAHTLGGLTVYLAEGLTTVNTLGQELVEGLTYQSSEKLYSGRDVHDVEKAKTKAYGEFQTNATAAYYERMLQGVYQDPTLELQHIIAAANTVAAYPYHIYGITSEAQ